MDAMRRVSVSVLSEYCMFLVKKGGENSLWKVSVQMVRRKEAGIIS